MFAEKKRRGEEREESVKIPAKERRLVLPQV